MSFGLIFDLDGTLLDTVPAIEQSQKEVFGRYGVALPPGYSDNFAGIPLKEIVDMVNKDFGKSIDWRAVGEQTEAIQFGVWERGQSIVFEGLVDLLNEAQWRGIAMAIGTSSTLDRAHHLLDLSRLWKYFDVYVGLECVENGKPAPDIFLEDSRQLGYHSDRCVVVGDGRSDMIAARAGGMKFVGFAPCGGKDRFSDADLVISSYRAVSCRDLECLLYRD